MSKMVPKAKHTPLEKSEKFWETSDIQSQPKGDESVEDLLKIIIAKLDKIIEKQET